MSKVTQQQIEKLEEIMLGFGEAHNLLAKTSLSKEEYQPISGLLAKAKVELFNFYNEHKAALQNKVSDISAEEVLFNHIVSFKKIEDKNDEYFFPYKSSDEMVKQESICKVFIGAMQEYASIVNEREDNGSWVSVEDRLPENNVWVLVANKDGVFTECGIHCKDCETGHGAETGWLLSGSPHPETRITHWMPLPAPPESQPQQKEDEESEKELEERTEMNMNVISDFCEYVKNEVGLVIPESTILSFFNA